MENDVTTSNEFYCHVVLFPHRKDSFRTRNFIREKEMSFKEEFEVSLEKEKVNDKTIRVSEN